MLPPIITFTKVQLPYGWLGNMAPYPVLYQGKEWKTNEALFQALRFEDEGIREIIRSQPSPMGAKMKSKAHKSEMVIMPMSAPDVENMRLVVRLKFEQHPKLLKCLKATGTSELVEDIGNRNGERHLFWGKKKINGEWTGNNQTGKILMETRDIL